MYFPSAGDVIAAKKELRAPVSDSDDSLDQLLGYRALPTVKLSSIAQQSNPLYLDPDFDIGIPSLSTGHHDRPSSSLGHELDLDVAVLQAEADVGPSQLKTCSDDEDCQVSFSLFTDAQT